MAIYPCGDSTSIYYLIVSGLPWSATWQELKDFVMYPESGRTINVEYVCIYPHATDGWVKLRNKEDFNRAYGKIASLEINIANLMSEYLNGRVFQGKAIIADDRNGYDIVNLRDMEPIQTLSTRRERSTNASCALPSPHSVRQSSTGSYAIYRSSRQNSQQDIHLPRWPTSNADSQLTNYSPTSTDSNIGILSQYPTNYESYAPYSPTQYDYVPPTIQPHLSGPLQASIYAQEVQIRYQPCLLPISPISQLGRTPLPALQYQYPAIEQNHQIVQSVPRKIIITYLPDVITDNELQALLERAAHKSETHSGPQADESPIESFQLLRYRDGRIKGHAFATFFSSNAAEGVVDVLHRNRYRGRRLEARLTKEGVESIRQAPLILGQQVYTPTSGHPADDILARRIGDMSLTKPKNSFEYNRRSKSGPDHHSTQTFERDGSSGTQSSLTIPGSLVVDGSQ